MSKNHDLVDASDFPGLCYELRSAKDKSDNPISDLFNAWIFLDNEPQLNSFTTDMLKSLVLAFKKASNDRRVNAIVLSGKGHKAFCTGGNTQEYADYYAGNPQEYKQYLRIFNDVVTGILLADKPVVCRTNGMRIGGGQELGLACDFSIAQDLALFGQAGPKHGSAPIGGSTDFLPLFVGIEYATAGCTLCEAWSAHQAYRLGLLYEIVPALKINHSFVPNPLVVTDRLLDTFGRMVLGNKKTGSDYAQGKALLKEGVVDLSLLDQAVEKLCAQLLHTFPGCTMRTLQSLREHKLTHWQKNCEFARDWLALNMMTEAKAGFTAFAHGPKHQREIDFVGLRTYLATGKPWTDALVADIQPKHADTVSGSPCRAQGAAQHDIS